MPQETGDLPAWIGSGAEDIATFVAIYRFDYESARSLQNWATPHHERTGGRYFTMFGHCFAGIAANEQLDVLAVEQQFRTALQVARESGGLHSQAARLASALLGELLHERNELTEAGRLIDEGYEGARVADTLSLPRLRARIDAECLRWGSTGAPSDGHDADDDSRDLPAITAPDSAKDGMAVITTEFDRIGEIRALITERLQRKAHQACAPARELVDDIAPRGRPKALLQAKLLHAAALSAADLSAEAKRVLAPAAAQCARHSLIRLCFDGGQEIVPTVTELCEDRRNDRWRPEWPPVPDSFFSAVMEAAAQY